MALPSVTTFPNVGGAVRNSDGQITDYVIVCDDLREVPYEVERMRMCYYAKAILHPSSAGSGHTVVVIYGQFNSLALAYAGDESWTQLQPPHPRTFMDIIFRKGLLHAMEYTGELMVFDLDTPGSPMVTWVAGPDSRLGCYNQKCLVKSPDGKGMFQGWRDSDWVPVDGNKQRESVFPGDARMSTEFVIFKLDERRNDWSAVKDLGDLALFLGLNCSMVLSTREFPELASSCFNFIDDYRDGCIFEQQAIRNVGVFDLKYESFRRYDSHLTDSEWNRPPQIWIMPTLHLSQVCSP